MLTTTIIPVLPESMTLSEWGHYWLNSFVRPAAKPGGYEHYRDNLTKHILPKLGNLPLRELTAPVIQHFLDEEKLTGNLRDGGPLSEKSIKNMRVVLEACCQRAVAEGYLKENPVRGTIIQRCSTKKFPLMKEADLITLEDHLVEHRSSEGNAVRLAMAIGPRLGEICALRWRNYDFETGCLHFEETVRRIAKDNSSELEYGTRTELVFTPVKTMSSDRKLYLSDDLREVIMNQYETFRKMFGTVPKQGDFIFFNRNGGNLDPDNLSSFFSKLLVQLGIPHVNFHALRHTFASRALENGMPLSTLAGILGHSKVSTTMHFYIHACEDTMKQATMGLGRIRKDAA